MQCTIDYNLDGYIQSPELKPHTADGGNLAPPTSPNAADIPVAHWEPEARAMLSTSRDVLRIFSCNHFANGCFYILVFAQHFWSAGAGEPKVWQMDTPKET